MTQKEIRFLSLIVSIAMLVLTAVLGGFTWAKQKEMEAGVEAGEGTSAPILVLVDEHQEPVITVHSPGARRQQVRF